MARNWGGASAWGGLLNTSNNAVTMGMNLMQLNQQREHQQALESTAAAQLKMAQESHQQNMAVNAIKLQEAKKLQEEYEKPLDMTMHPMFLGLPKESKDAALQSMYQMGLVNEAGIGKTGDIMKGVKNIMATEDLGKMVMQPIVAQRKEVALQAYNELQEEIAKPNANPEKIKTLTAQFNKVNGAYQSSAGGFTKWLEDVQKNTQAKEIELMKETAAQKRHEESMANTLKAASIRSRGDGEKPSRVAYRDTKTQAIYYYDKNNPQDRKQLETFGSRLVPVYENPIQTEVRGALSGGAGVASPPEGFVYKGTQNGKKVYVKGNKAWVEP